MNVNELRDVSITIRLPGTEITDYILSEIDPDVEQDWTEAELKEYFWTEAKDIIKREFRTIDIKVQVLKERSDF